MSAKLTGMSWQYGNEKEVARLIELESDGAEAIRKFAFSQRDVIAQLWSWGDGRGGGILALLAEGADISLEQGKPVRSGRGKLAISAGLRTRVYERDAYRCVTCGGHVDLTCDHIVPESKGGPTTFENLQTMCRSCNSRKGTKI